MPFKRWAAPNSDLKIIPFSDYNSNNLGRETLPRMQKGKVLLTVTRQACAFTSFLKNRGRGGRWNESRRGHVAITGLWHWLAGVDFSQAPPTDHFLRRGHQKTGKL